MADASFPVCWLEVWPADSGVVSLHRSHYLKSSALKQKVRDQQILTSGQAYDSILMQFPNSSSLIITLPPANLISHLSNFRHISSASNFTELHRQNILRLPFQKNCFHFVQCSHQQQQRKSKDYTPEHWPTLTPQEINHFSNVLQTLYEICT